MGISFNFDIWVFMFFQLTLNNLKPQIFITLYLLIAVMNTNWGMSDTLESRIIDVQLTVDKWRNDF
jgi:hypothetical protein